MNKEFLKSLMFLLLLAIAQIPGVVSAGYLKEISGNVTYTKADSDGHVAGELYTSLTDVNGNYLDTMGNISVTGDYNCVENLSQPIINGGFNYILGEDVTQCDLDQLIDGSTYTITTNIDTDNDGIVETNGDDYISSFSYIHHIYYDKSEVDSIFIKNTDILDSSGIVTKESLPYKQGQLVGSGGNLLECTSSGCDLGYYDVTNLNPGTVIKGNSYGVNGEEDGGYDTTNLIPENVKKGISFGLNEVGVMENDTGTGIVATLAGPLCSDSGVECYLFDYNGDDYDDLIRKRIDGDNGHEVLEFMIFFTKGSKFILDKTLDLETSLFGNISNDRVLKKNEKQISFFKGKEFFDFDKDGNSDYIKIDTNIVLYNDSRPDYSVQTSTKIIKIDYLKEGGFIELKNLFFDTGNTYTRISSSGNHVTQDHNNWKTSIIKDNIAKTTIINTNWIQKTDLDQGNGLSDTIEKFYYLQNGENAVLINNELIESRKRRVGDRDGTSSQTFFLNNKILPSGNGTSLNKLFSIKEGSDLYLDYPNSIFYIRNKNEFYAYNTITHVETLLINDENFALMKDDDIFDVDNNNDGDRHLTYYNNIYSGNGNYFFIKKDETHRLNKNTTVRRYIDTTLSKFYYNPTSKLIEYLGDITVPTYQTLDDDISILFTTGIKDFGNGYYNGDGGYQFNYNNGNYFNYYKLFMLGLEDGGDFKSLQIELPNNKIITHGTILDPRNGYLDKGYTVFENNENTGIIYHNLIFKFHLSNLTKRGDSYVIMKKEKIVGNLLIIDYEHQSDDDRETVNGKSIKGMWKRELYGKVYNTNNDEFLFNESINARTSTVISWYGDNRTIEVPEFKINGTGAIAIINDTLYNSYTGNPLLNFEYNNTSNYLNSTFDNYKYGNYYILPGNDGNNWLYEFLPETQELILRSNNVILKNIDGDLLTIQDNNLNSTYVISIKDIWNNKKIINLSFTYFNIAYNFNGELYLKKIEIGDDINNINNLSNELLKDYNCNEPTFKGESNEILVCVNNGINYPTININNGVESTLNLGSDYDTRKYISLNYSNNGLYYGYDHNNDSSYRFEMNGEYLFSGDSNYNSILVPNNDGTLIIYTDKYNEIHISNKDHTNIRSLGFGKNPIFSQDENYFYYIKNDDNKIYKQNISTNDEILILNKEISSFKIDNQFKYIFYTDLTGKMYVKNLNDNNEGTLILTNSEDFNINIDSINNDLFQIKLLGDDNYLYGTDSFLIDGKIITGPNIPYNTNEMVIMYYYLKYNISINYETYYNDILTYIINNGDVIINFKNNDNTENHYFDTSLGVFNDIFISDNSYKKTKDNLFLFTNSVRDLNIINNDIVKYSILDTNNSYFNIIANKELINSNNFNFYILNDNSIILFTKNKLFSALSINGFSNYYDINDLQGSIDKYLLEKRYFYLNNDYSLRDTLNYYYIYTDIVNGKSFWTKYNITTKELKDITLAQLGNILFIDYNNRYYNTKEYFDNNLKNLGTNDFFFGLNSTYFVSTTNFSNSFIDGTDSNKQNIDSEDKLLLNQTKLLLNDISGNRTTSRRKNLKRGGGCGVNSRGSRANEITLTNKIIELNDNSKYIVNGYYSKDRRSRKNYRTCYGYYYYIAENIDNGDIMLIPYYNGTLFENNDDGTTSIKIKLNNFTNYITINNYNDYLNIINNKGLYSSYLNRLFNGRGGHNMDNMYIIDNKLIRKYNEDGIDMKEAYNKENFFQIETQSDFVSNNYDNNTFTGITAPNEVFWNILSTNFVTDGVYLSHKIGENGEDLYKVNNINNLILGDGGTSVSKIEYFGDNTYKITQSGNNGEDYSNKTYLYLYENNNLTYLYKLLSSNKYNGTYSGLDYVITETIYEDQSGITWIEIKNSLFPGLPIKTRLDTTNGTINLNVLGGYGASPELYDNGNKKFVYNVLQNTIIINDDLFDFSTYQKITGNNIYILKTPTINKYYIIDINGNFKSIIGNNSDNLIEFNFDGFVKLGNDDIGIEVKKRDYNLINDINLYNDNEFFKNTSIIVSHYENETTPMDLFTYNGFIGTYDYNTETLKYLNIINDQNVSNIIYSLKGKDYLFGYDSINEKASIWTIDTINNILELSDVENSPTFPTFNSNLDAMYVNGLKFTINDQGLFSMEAVDPDYGTIEE